MNPEESPQPVKKKRRLLGCLLTLVVLVVLVLGVLIGGAVYVGKVVTKTRADAIAEADRLDPGWRLDEIEARREVLSDETNSAIRVGDVLEAMPPDWKKLTPTNQTGEPDWANLQGLALYDVLSKDTPAVQLLTKEQADAARAERERVRDAIDMARDLVRFPKGRNVIDWRPNYMEIPLTHAQEARNVVRLLYFDAIVRVQDGDPDGALATCRAVLYVGRSIGDEPISMSQFVRMAFQGVDTEATERILARGEPGEDALIGLQDDLNTEIQEPLALDGLCGERAMAFKLFHSLDTGEVSIQQLSGGPWQRSRINPVGHLMFQYNQGLSLHFLNQAVEIAKKPFYEQLPLWEQLQADTDPRPMGLPAKLSGALTYLLMPAVVAFAKAEIRSQAILRAAVVLLASERYRHARGQWPETPEAIEKALSVRLPRDPYTGAPFRLKQTDDGLVVYSLGPDRKDNGGNLNNRKPDLPNVDVGYRLWNVNLRRREPPKSETPKP